ncbi:MAG: ThuA domain-containing protein [Lachnospiraceae bacterium]|nr:ThuA domain-containing protein [Lachnospiraceae bacterium]
MEKIKLHYLIGDVHMGGHDVHRVALNNRILLDRAGAFDVMMVCDDDRIGDISFDNWFLENRVNECDAVIFNCGNYRFNTRGEQIILERAVAEGKGFIFLHGDHPCYWKEAGMEPWPELEKMAMLMWREVTSHGDYGDHHITICDQEHPITKGLPDFDTRDEVFCNMQNIHGVEFTTLAAAYSDPNVISRHGLPGTGQDEPVALVGRYGKGRTYNQALGHVWPYYTGHGLGENTMASFAPRTFRKMFVRGCEWAATGKVELTESFDGEAILK